MNVGRFIALALLDDTSYIPIPKRAPGVAHAYCATVARLFVCGVPEFRTHVVTTSYLSPAMRALDKEARAGGVVVLKAEDSSERYVHRIPCTFIYFVLMLNLYRVLG
jgi:hypothetical protein